MSPERKQRLYLIFIMIMVAIGVGAISIFNLYVAELEHHRLQMVNTVQERADVLKAVARYNLKQSTIPPRGNIEATLAQFREVHKSYKGFGHSEEYTLAKLENGQILILLSQHAPDLYDGSTKTPLPNSIPFDSANAEPMRRALNGESGSMIGMGFRGQPVMAAYRPVDVLNFGLVISIDLSEIKAPFIDAGLMAIAGGFSIILLGVAAFYRASEPLVKKLDEQNKELSDEIAIRKASEERLMLVLEGADAGTWDWNTQTNVVLFDDRSVEMFGYTQSEFEPSLQAWEKLLHSEDLLDVQKLLQDHLLGKTEFYEAEYRLRHKSGEWLWILDKGKVVQWDSEGKPLRACGTFLDISQRKRIEQKLRTSEARHRGLIETMTSIQWNTDPMGAFAEPQHSWEKFTGQSWEEHRGWGWAEKLHPDDRERIKAGWEKALTRMTRYETYGRIWHHATEGYRNFIVCAIPLFAANGSVDQWVGTITDVTEKITAEEKIQKLSAVIEQSPVGILITDLSGNIEYANPTLLKNSGYSLNEMIGENPRIFKSGESPQSYYQLLWEKISVGKEWRGVFHNKKKDGQLFWESVLIFPLKIMREKFQTSLALRKILQRRNNWKVPSLTMKD